MNYIKSWIILINKKSKTNKSIKAFPGIPWLIKVMSSNACKKLFKSYAYFFFWRKWIMLWKIGKKNIFQKNPLKISTVSLTANKLKFYGYFPKLLKQPL